MSPPRELARSLFPNLLAGLTSGLVALVYSISFAALIFSGRLTHYFPQGVGVALTGAMVTAIVVAWRSPFPFTIAGPEANSAILITLAAGAIGTALEAPERDAAVFPTIWAAIALSTLGTGLFLYTMGRFRLGRLARYFPYPVIGGFLAGTGWLITRSAFKVMTGTPLGFGTIATLVSPAIAPRWISGALMTAVLFVALNRYKHFLTLPVVLLGGTLAGNLGRGLVSPAPGATGAEGWFFEAFSRDRVWQAWSPDTLAQIDWAVLSHQGGTLLAVMLIVMISILLNSTGLELATSRSVDLDQELRANGVANLVNGCLGGMVGYLSINRCLLNQQAGARSPMAATLAGLVCGAALVFDSSFLAYVPKPVLGGLLLYIGSNLLVCWIWKAWSQFPPLEYALVVTILVVIASFGFLQGVGMGTLIACVLFILSYGRTSCVKYTLTGRTCRSHVVRSTEDQAVLEEQGDATLVLALNGFVFFGTANEMIESIRRRLGASGTRPLAFVVLDFRLVTGVDSSAVLSLAKLRQLAEKAGLQLLFTHVRGTVEAPLRRGGLLGEGGCRIRCFEDLDHGMEWCEERILAAATPTPADPKAPLDAQLDALLDNSGLVGRLKGYLDPVELPQGRHLFHQGDAPDGIYFLESGRVSVVAELAHGKQLRRGTYTGGAILGEMGFYSQVPRSASVVADQPSRLLYLSHQAFTRMQFEAPDLGAAFSRGMVNLVA